MKISVLKSTELTKEDWRNLTTGFNESFNHNKKENELKAYYHNNPFGYSYHAIIRDETGMIFGHTSAIPISYIIQGKESTFGLSGGTYVLKAYRKDAFVFLDLSDALKSYCAKDGLSVIYGVSNKNSFQFAVKILGSTYLKDLKYYLLPVSIFKIIGKLRFGWFDKMLKIPWRIWVMINKLISFFSNSKEKEYPVRLKMSEEFLSYRFNDKYTYFRGKKTEGIYRIFDEKGINTAYIMDFRENEKRTFKALVHLITQILNKEKVDAILFIGELNLRQFLLLPVPQNKAPQRFPLTYDLLDNNSEFAAILSNPENWDFGLINYDVR